MRNLIRQSFNVSAVTAGIIAASGVAVHAQSFTAGDIVIYRVGTGSAALSSAATAVFLDEYTTGGTLVESIAMPTSVSGANQILTASGTATSEGMLNLSSNGQYLAVTGYDATVGTAGVATSASATVARVVGIVGVNGAADTTTALTSSVLTGSNIRSAFTTDGTSIYIGDAVGGIDYATTGSSTAIQIGQPSTGTPVGISNARDVEVVNGQLYASTASGSFRIATVGTGTPTTSSQTVTEVPGIATTVTPYAFSFTTLGAGSAPNTLYVADTNSIDKFSLISGTWTATGTITGVSGIEGLTETTVNGIASLYGTDSGGLYSFTDSTGFNGTVSGAASLIASAGTNEAFRGVAFAPSISNAAAPEPGSVALLGLGLLPIGAVVRRRVSRKG